MGGHRARHVSGSARKSQVLSLRGKTQKLHEPPCDFNPISVVLRDLNECAIQPLESIRQTTPRATLKVSTIEEQADLPVALVAM